MAGNPSKGSNPEPGSWSLTGSTDWFDDLRTDQQRGFCGGIEKILLMPCRVDQPGVFAEERLEEF
jgi:hypothetical protein